MDDFDDLDAKLIVSIILAIIFLALSYGIVVNALSASYQLWQIVVVLGILWIVYIAIEYLMYHWDDYFQRST